jgi:hypothetical protein
VDGVNTYTVDLAYAAGLGVPTVSLKGVQVVLPISVSLPVLGNYSQIDITLTCQYTASSTSKQIFTRLNNTQFSALQNNTANQITSVNKYGFRNVGVKNKQESLFSEVSGNPTGQSNADLVKMTQDTSVDSVLFFRSSAVTANEMLCIRHISVTRKW